MANRIRVTLAAAAALGCLAGHATAAFASATYHGFAVQKHYVIEGGTPASFEQTAAQPLSVFRSVAAYANFRAHLGGFLNREVSDADFRKLILSDRVKLVDCVGTINTSGITDAGRVGDHTRNCYTSPRFGVEKLIALRLDDGRWVIVGSIWCWNPVKGKVPPAPLPPPPPIAFVPPPNQFEYRTERFSATTPASNSMFLAPVALTDCCCQTTVVGGYMVNVTYTDRSTTYIMARD